MFDLVINQLDAQNFVLQ